MKHVKLFEDFWPFSSKCRTKPQQEEEDYSSLDPNDPSLVPFDLFHHNPTVREIINKKEAVLERDPDFRKIMKQIESGKIKKAVELETDNFYDIGKTYKLKLKDETVVVVKPVNTWETSSGDYDEHIEIHVNNKPMGYMSGENWRIVKKAVEDFLKF